MSEPQSAQYLLVRLAGREFGIHADRVHGMVQASSLELCPTPRRGAIAWLARVHGRELPVLELHTLLHLRSRPVSSRSCLILISGEGDGPEFALLADSISRIEKIPAHLTRLDPDGEFAVAQIRIGDKWRDVLDIDKIAAS
jgi:chemotaxis signal transduction protein